MDSEGEFHGAFSDDDLAVLARPASNEPSSSLEEKAKDNKIYHFKKKRLGPLKTVKGLSPYGDHGWVIYGGPKMTVEEYERLDEEIIFSIMSIEAKIREWHQPVQFSVNKSNVILAPSFKKNLLEILGKSEWEDDYLIPTKKLISRALKLKPQYTEKGRRFYTLEGLKVFFSPQGIIAYSVEKTPSDSPILETFKPYLSK